MEAVPFQSWFLAKESNWFKPISHAHFADEVAF